MGIEPMSNMLLIISLRKYPYLLFRIKLKNKTKCFITSV